MPLQNGPMLVHSAGADLGGEAALANPGFPREQDTAPRAIPCCAECLIEEFYFTCAPTSTGEKAASSKGIGRNLAKIVARARCEDKGYSCLFSLQCVRSLAYLPFNRFTLLPTPMGTCRGKPFFMRIIDCYPAKSCGHMV